MSTCPAKGCGVLIGSEQVACPRHWFTLPKPMRDRIWQLYRREPGSDAHRTLVFEAVAILAEGKKA